MPTDSLWTPAERAGGRPWRERAEEALEADSRQRRDSRDKATPEPDPEVTAAK